MSKQQLGLIDLYKNRKIESPETRKIGEIMIKSIDELNKFHNNLYISSQYLTGVEDVVGSSEFGTLEAQKYSDEIMYQIIWTLKQVKESQYYIRSYIKLLQDIYSCILNIDLVKKKKLVKYMNVDTVYNITRAMFKDDEYKTIVYKFALYLKLLPQFEEYLTFYIKESVTGILNVIEACRALEYRYKPQKINKMIEPTINKIVINTAKEAADKLERLVSIFKTNGDKIIKNTYASIKYAIDEYTLKHRIDPVFNDPNIVFPTFEDMAVTHRTIKDAIDYSIADIQKHINALQYRYKMYPIRLPIKQPKRHEFEVDLKDTMGNTIMRRLSVYQNQSNQVLKCLHEDTENLGACVKKLNLDKKDAAENRKTLLEIIKHLNGTPKNEFFGGSDEIKESNLNMGKLYALLAHINKSASKYVENVKMIEDRNKNKASYVKIANTFFEKIEDNYKKAREYIKKINDHVNNLRGYMKNLKDANALGTNTVSEIVNFQKHLDKVLDTIKTNLNKDVDVTKKNNFLGGAGEVIFKVLNMREYVEGVLKREGYKVYYDQNNPDHLGIYTGDIESQTHYSYTDNIVLGSLAKDTNPNANKSFLDNDKNILSYLKAILNENMENFLFDLAKKIDNVDEYKKYEKMKIIEHENYIKMLDNMGSKILNYVIRDKRIEYIINPNNANNANDEPEFVKKVESYTYRDYIKENYIIKEAYKKMLDDVYNYLNNDNMLPSTADKILYILKQAYEDKDSQRDLIIKSYYIYTIVCNAFEYLRKKIYLINILKKKKDIDDIFNKDILKYITIHLGYKVSSTAPLYNFDKDYYFTHGVNGKSSIEEGHYNINSHIIKYMGDSPFDVMIKTFLYSSDNNTNNVIEYDERITTFYDVINNYYNKLNNTQLRDIFDYYNIINKYVLKPEIVFLHRYCIKNTNTNIVEYIGYIEMFIKKIAEYNAKK